MSSKATRNRLQGQPARAPPRVWMMPENVQPKKPGEIRVSDLRAFKLFKPFGKFLEKLRQAEPVTSKKRELHFDEYVSLLLFYFFNPVVESLRGLQATTKLKKVQRKVCNRRVRVPEILTTSFPEIMTTSWS